MKGVKESFYTIKKKTIENVELAADIVGRPFSTVLERSWWSRQVPEDQNKTSFLFSRAKKKTKDLQAAWLYLNIWENTKSNNTESHFQA